MTLRSGDACYEVDVWERGAFPKPDLPFPEDTVKLSGIPAKTLYIALNYEEQAERMNAESAHEIAKELFALECEQRRLTYFIGLLDKRQAEVIRLVFVDGIPTKEVAASFGLTYRTIDRIKRTAIENLVEMYAYSDQFQV